MRNDLSRAATVSGISQKRDEYDFSKSVKSPCAKRLKKRISIRLDAKTIAYFKAMAEEDGIQYQSLINLYLRDCAEHHRKLKMEWSWPRCAGY
jgi:uncharacterized protein (DUF4415 family)